MPATTILVIDDEKLIRWSISTILGRAGYRVREAATGKEGLAAVASSTPNLVILDISLPDMDGFDVLKELRQAHPELPVLTMTADATPETARRALRLGACGHLEKPCDSAVLLAAVADAQHPITRPGQINQ
jgi:DNA-binding NtrC family response regulator